jgi:hypothetical protein
MKAVLSRSVPKGLDLAAAVLKEQGISNQKIHKWRPRQQEQALEIAAGGEVSAEAAKTGTDQNGTNFSCKQLITIFIRRCIRRPVWL